MNDIQCLIDRQLGIYCRLNYDNILKRLVVNGEESYYGLQNTSFGASFDQDPPIFACRFSEAPGYQNILALANEDGRVAIQDTTSVISANKLESFQCHNNAVFDLAWMPGYMNFVTVSGDHTACLWDVGSGSPRRVQVFSHHTRSVKTAVFRPQEPSVFATGARDGHILVWDVRTNTSPPPLILKPDNGLMNCHSSFTPKTPGSHSKRPRIDNYRAISITGLVFQDDATLISCGECDGKIKVWDLRKNYSIYKREPLPKHSIPYCGSSTKNGYTNLIIDDSRMRLYASCMDDVIYCFNVSTYGTLPEQRYIGHENSTFYIKTGLSPDCMYLVSGSSDKSAYIWNVKHSEPVVRLAGHRAEVTCAAWGPSGGPRGAAVLVTCSDDARHKLWRVGRECRDPDVELQGRAIPVPRTDLASLPKWGSLDKTPNSLKRKSTTTPGSYGAKRSKSRGSTSARKTKRCLADLMNAARDTDEVELPGKRPRLQVPGAGEPRLQVPGAGEPRLQVPGAGEPRLQVPGAGEPRLQVPGAGEPRLQVPGAGEPRLQVPGAGEPRLQVPGAGEPRLQVPGAGEPRLQVPGAGEPRLQVPGAGEPRLQVPGAGEPRLQVPGAGEPRLQVPGAGEPRLLQAGSKRAHDSPPRTTFMEESSTISGDWGYIAPKAGTSFMTPTKNYERKACKRLSPKSPKPISPNGSPVKVSPSKVRIVSFSTPTKNLPNFVMNGDAPHLKLMSPVKKKQDSTDWLTLMLREKKSKVSEVADRSSLAAPLSPKETIPSRRNSVTEKTPKASTKKSRTLLKYFSVTNKDK